MDTMQLIKDAILKVDTSKAGKLAAITAATEIRDLGLDSVATMEMVGILEETLGTNFADEEMIKISTFGDLQKLVDSKRK